MHNEKVKTFAKFFSLVLAVFLLLALIFKIGYFFGYKTGFSRGAADVKTNLDKELAFLLGQEPEKLFTLSGTISEIKDKTLLVNTSKNLYGLEALESMIKGKGRSVELRIKIMIDKQTELEKFVSDKEGNVSTQKISFEELKPMNNITIESDENIKGKNEFSAKRIRLVQ